MATSLEELTDGLNGAGIDYKLLVSTSPGADRFTVLTVNCAVGMLLDDDRFTFGPPDLAITSYFYFKTDGSLDTSRSTFNLAVAFDTSKPPPFDPPARSFLQ